MYQLIEQAGFENECVLAESESLGEIMEIKAETEMNEEGLGGCADDLNLAIFNMKTNSYEF